MSSNPDERASPLFELVTSSLDDVEAPSLSDMSVELVWCTFPPSDEDDDEEGWMYHPMSLANSSS